MFGGNNDSVLMALVVVIVVIALFFMVKPRKSKNVTENYNAGNNIDFRKQKTDRNLPDDVMPHTDVPNVGSPFVIIDNS